MEHKNTSGSEGGYPYYPDFKPSILRRVMNRYNISSQYVRFFLGKPIIDDILRVTTWLAVIKVLFFL
jgi:hypothetical protein